MRPFAFVRDEPGDRENFWGGHSQVYQFHLRPISWPCLNTGHGGYDIQVTAKTKKKCAFADVHSQGVENCLKTAKRGARNVCRSCGCYDLDRAGASFAVPFVCDKDLCLLRRI